MAVGANMIPLRKLQLDRVGSIYETIGHMIKKTGKYKEEKSMITQTRYYSPGIGC
jgi:hypothetical protein